MFDFAWSELIIIGGVALIVIGPKDLPRALRTLGMIVRKARALAHEFHSTFDEMIREAELDEVHKAAHDASRFKISSAFNKVIEGETSTTTLPPSAPPLPELQTQVELPPPDHSAHVEMPVPEPAEKAAADHAAPDRPHTEPPHP